MEMTYDWLNHARNNPELKQKIKDIINSCQNTELTYQNMYRITFENTSQSVIVRPFSETSDFHYKIFNTRITYRAVLKLIDGNFEDILSSDITRLD